MEATVKVKAAVVAAAVAEEKVAVVVVGVAEEEVLEVAAEDVIMEEETDIEEGEDIAIEGITIEDTTTATTTHSLDIRFVQDQIFFFTLLLEKIIAPLNTSPKCASEILM